MQPAWHLIVIIYMLKFMLFILAVSNHRLYLLNKYKKNIPGWIFHAVVVYRVLYALPTVRTERNTLARARASNDTG